MPVLCPLEVGASEGNCAPHREGLLSEKSVGCGPHASYLGTAGVQGEGTVPWE